MTLNSELDQWQPAGHAVRIEYLRAVIEQLRLAVTEGFNRIPHGGVEVGGILFGIRDEGTVRILAHRELMCEHAFGPSFVLSDEDRKVMAELLHAPETDLELRSMEPVGWYLSHNRSEIRLTEQDLELYEQYFPESWQIALVLRPHRSDPLRAGFFFREPDGFVNADATHQEFLIPPASGKPGSASSPLEQHQPVPLENAVPQLDRVDEAAQIPSRPRSAGGRNAGKHNVRWVRVAAASAVLLACGLYWIGKSGRATGVALRAVDIGTEQLRIDWDHAAPAIQRSAGGELEIQDGTERTRGELSRDLLLTGHVTYLRTSGRVTVRLVLRDADGGTVAEVTGFSGAPVLNAAVPGAVSAPPVVAAAPRENLQRMEETAAPSQREQELDRMQELPKRVPATEPAQLAANPAASDPARLRRWVAPAPTVLLQPAELPSPPTLADSSPAIPSIIPHTPVHVAPTLPDLPSSGKLIWTGKLARGGTIQILGNHASPGRVTGTLPGTPIRVSVFPTELTQSGLKVFTGDALSVGVPEAPGAQNGWMATTWVLNAKKASDLRIIEAPAQSNGWNRLSVKAEHGDHTVIVLHWDRLNH